MSPCDGRGALATRRDLLAGGLIEIRSEPVEPHPRSAPERGNGRLGAYESMPAQRGKLADRDSIPGHDERLAVVKLAHNVAAVVTQLPLGDLFGHTRSVAPVLRCSVRGANHRSPRLAPTYGDNSRLHICLHARQRSGSRSRLVTAEPPRRVNEESPSPLSPRS